MAVAANDRNHHGHRWRVVQKSGNSHCDIDNPRMKNRGKYLLNCRFNLLVGIITRTCASSGPRGLYIKRRIRTANMDVRYKNEM